tara:strand:- start:590 stop:808 length:219 start_codon:yes stop_codon:yes gene_type:complete
MEQSNKLSIAEMHEVHRMIGQDLFKKEILFEKKKERHGMNAENIFLKTKPKPPPKTRPRPKPKPKPTPKYSK